MYKDEFPSEEELQLALRRLEPPPDFATGVLARLAEQEQEPSEASRSAGVFRLAHARRPKWSFAGYHPALAAALLLMLLLLPLGGYLHRRHQQAQAEAAAQQFGLAMRLTHAALVNAAQQVAGHGHTHELDE